MSNTAEDIHSDYIKDSYDTALMGSYVKAADEVFQGDDLDYL